MSPTERGRSPAQAGSRCVRRKERAESYLVSSGSGQRRMKALRVAYFPSGILA